MDAGLARGVKKNAPLQIIELFDFFKNSNSRFVRFTIYTAFIYTESAILSEVRTAEQRCFGASPQWNVWTIDKADNSSIVGSHVHRSLLETVLDCMFMLSGRGVG